MWQRIWRLDRQALPPNDTRARCSQVVSLGIWSSRSHDAGDICGSVAWERPQLASIFGPNEDDPPRT